MHLNPIRKTILGKIRDTHHIQVWLKIFCFQPYYIHRTVSISATPTN